MSMTVRELTNLLMVGDWTNFIEMRMENDGDGNPIYVGYTNVGNAPTDEPVWFITKYTYDANQSPTRQQMPDSGVQFIYVWDDRATYFA